ncbi:MAG: lycopene beta-cyclase CrtY [Maricaulaceae bacterium]
MTETGSHLLIVGAGLSGLMTAWACLDRNSDLMITMIDEADQIGGDHTWSFNLSDIPENLQEWMKPFIAHQWKKYDVVFPKRKRRLDIPYCTGNSDTLREVVRPFLKSGRLKLKLGQRAVTLQARSAGSHVELENGEIIKGDAVIDARGFSPNEFTVLGYQKFVGWVIRTDVPHGLDYPIIMDATVPQLGGYRFVYCLPYTDREILVEDTYYTDGNDLADVEVAARVNQYIKAKGWGDHKLLRQEKGVLPITLASQLVRPYTAVPKIGIGGEFYHAVTGYSVPQAVRIAHAVAGQIQFMDKLDVLSLNACVGVQRVAHHKNERFFRLLNRMLFRAARPEKRYKVLQRFYGLSEPLIRRFYAGHLTRKDKIRLLVGKPPVPVHKALYNLSARAFMSRERKRKTTHDAS